jgi:Dual specificity phosphatase, catalytic domain
MLTPEDINRRNKMIFQENLDNICHALQMNLGPGISNLSEITTNIYLSGYDPSLNLALLRSNHISAILYLGTEPKDKSILQKYGKKKIQHMQIAIEDNPNVRLAPHFETCYKYIHAVVEQENKILIHCMEGVSRSVTMLSYYFLKRYYVTNSEKLRDVRRIINQEIYFLPKILAFIKDCRPCICPNSGFVAQLLNVEMQLKKYIENSFHDELTKKKKKKKTKKPDRDEPLKKSKKKAKPEVIYDQLSDLAVIAPPKIEPATPPKHDSSSEESASKSAVSSDDEATLLE